MAALEEEDDDDDDGEEYEGRKKMEVKAHQASHTNYLMMRGYCSPGIVKRRDLNTADSIVVESCLVRLKLRNTPAHHVCLSVEALDLTKCGPSLLPASLTYSTRFSCSFPSSVKECENRLIQQRGYTLQDTEACVQLMRSLDAAGEKGLDIHDLYQTLNQLEEPQCGRTRGLQQYMQELQEEGQVLQVGSLGIRWVLMQHAEPWLLALKSKPLSQSRLTSDSLQNPYNSSFPRKRCRRQVRQEAEEPPAKKPAVDKQACEDIEDVEGEERDGKAGNENMETVGRCEKKELIVRDFSVDNKSDEKGCSPPPGSAADDDDNVSFISRPWRMVDGSLNRPVGKGMLEAVLYHIMSRPGLTLQKLMEHYKDVLQPMALLDLVQALVEMGCLTKKTLVKVPKPSLFSHSAVNQTRSETKMKIEEPDTVFYEPTISCILRLSQALPNERHWNNCLP